MDDKLNELREKQAEIGNKISLLQKTNKKKDEEAAEIRQLIKECRENLNRIKGLNADDSQGYEPHPCEGIDLDDFRDQAATGREIGSPGKEGGFPGKEAAISGEEPVGDDKGRSQYEKGEPKDQKHDPCVEKPKKIDCAELKRKRGAKDRVTCKVDLNKMKVRIRGPPEDLKRLDATHLINLLEKFQCQELIINAGDEVMQDPGEIRLIYLMHPGNIIMVAGIILVAFLINTNICHVESSRKQLFLNILYVGSFAFHYGMVLWMIFFRGYAMRIGLNDDVFHMVDNMLLPKYFSVCVLLSALSLYAFLSTHSIAPCSSWPLNVVSQVIIVVVTFFMELMAICYVVPAVVKLRSATDNYTIDEDEPDCNVPPSFEKNLTKLGKLSWTVCLINFLTLILLGANMYYITTKLKWIPYADGGLVRRRLCFYQFIAAFLFTEMRNEIKRKGPIMKTFVGFK